MLINYQKTERVEICTLFFMRLKISGRNDTYDNFSESFVRHFSESKYAGRNDTYDNFSESFVRHLGRDVFLLFSSIWKIKYFLY